jgi:hypothetical protein
MIYEAHVYESEFDLLGSNRLFKLNVAKSMVLKNHLVKDLPDCIDIKPQTWSYATFILS